MTISHILILGAGPAGAAAALAISQIPSSPPLRITVLELRPKHVKTNNLGGAINLTPSAMRYLDRMGVGTQVRRIGIPVGGVDNVALRTGRLLGTLWKGVDACRVMRADLVGVMRAGLEGREEEGVEIRYAVRVVEIREEDGKVTVKLDDGEEVKGDLLLGCDGLHSAARRLYVEPERTGSYSGKGVAYGFARVKEPGDAGLVRADGVAAVADTTMFTGRYGAVLASFYEPTRKRVFVGGVMGLREESFGPDGAVGFRVGDGDVEHVKGELRRRFGHSAVVGLPGLLESVEDWALFPVFTLPPGGRWARGRALLLGDAAHTMPPMGESIGLSIEDGALIARVLTRHRERSVKQMFADYEALRREPINKIDKELTWRWNNALKEDLGWLGTIFWECLAMLYLLVMRFKAKRYFSMDVEKLELPA
ncbi:hypothetical protein GE09DRAFT_1227861 [Coniochaeta sp. 2T2.1]|nr:hypothetical protein GE09DRAFT_1227861 [Coniochaeta sp. 2T2.1]